MRCLWFCCFAVLIGIFAAAPCLTTAQERTSPGDASTLPHWLGGPTDSNDTIKLTRDIPLDFAVQSAHVRVAGDFCRTALEINGRQQLVIAPYCATQTLDVTSALQRGSNELSLTVDQRCGPAAVALSMLIRTTDGKTITVVTDGEWQSFGKAGAKVSAMDRGKVRPELWGVGRTPITISAFENYEQWQQSLRGPRVKETAGLFVPRGFEATLVRKAEPEEGSWVSMAFDPQGRLTIAREDRGLLRMTLTADRKNVQSVQAIPVEFAECRGLVYVGDTLYANANNSKAMYRLRITEEGQFKDLQEIRAFAGNVGHGRNDLTWGPDGKLYSIHGDSVEPPGAPLIDHTSPFSASRAAKPPRAGYLLRVDREAKQWELLATGLRNPFGVACHPNGDVFTYDADNEYDMGMPWYRPTRIVQLTPGADYGYREANGLLPGRFPDQPDFTPPTLDIGRGSPTAVMFGTNLKFPSPYKDALYALDWSYGRVLAIHFVPRGAGYRAAAELFSQGRPLNVTDIAAGPDGAMYLITGGRKTQSALYRIAYRHTDTEELRDVPSLHEQEADRFFAERRATIKVLRSTSDETHIKNLGKLAASLNDPDPIFRSIARTTLERLPLESWKKLALESNEGPQRLTLLLSLARAGKPENVPAILNALRRPSFASLETTEQFTYLRILDLCREADPTAFAQHKAKIASELLAATSELTIHNSAVSYFGDRRDVRRRLALSMAHCESSSGISWILDSLLSSSVQEDRLAGLAALRNQKEGWKLGQRQRYFTVLNETSQMLGGQGLPIVQDKLRTAAIASLSEVEKKALGSLLTENAHSDEPLPPQRPVVQRWTLADLASLFEPAASSNEETRGNAVRGQQIFRDALCVRCHRSGLRGAAVGPDLTFVARRFNRRDMLESILSPSLSVAENYRNTIVETHAGKVYTGRVLEEGDFRSQVLKLNVDALRPGQIVEIDKKEIAEYQIAETSPMPQGLLDTFTFDDIRNLLAFLESAATNN